MSRSHHLCIYNLQFARWRTTNILTDNKKRKHFDTLQKSIKNLDKSNTNNKLQMWFSYQYWGCTQLEKSCWWIRGESVVFSRSQQKEGKWSPLFLLLKAHWTRWFPWTSDSLINKSKQCRWKQTLCCPTLAKTINWERNNHMGRGEEYFLADYGGTEPWSSDWWSLLGQL